MPTFPEEQIELERNQNWNGNCNGLEARVYVPERILAKRSPNRLDVVKNRRSLAAGTIESVKITPASVAVHAEHPGLVDHEDHLFNPRLIVC